MGGDARVTWALPTPGEKLLAPPGAAISAVCSRAGREPSKQTGTGTGKQVGAREVPGSLPGGSPPTAPQGRGFPLAQPCLQRQAGASVGPRLLPGRLRQSRKAPVPSLAPGQGQGRWLPSGGAEGISSVPSLSQEPARLRAPAALGHDRPHRRTPARLFLGWCLRHQFQVPGQGDKDTETGATTPGKMAGGPMGWFAVFPPPQCHAPSSCQSRAGPVAEPWPCRAVPTGWQWGFPRPAPHRGHPPFVYLHLPRLRCGRPARGSQGCRGGSGCGARAGCRLPAAAPFAPRQGEPSTKPFLA